MVRFGGRAALDTSLARTSPGQVYLVTPIAVQPHCRHVASRLTTSFLNVVVASSGIIFDWRSRTRGPHLARVAAKLVCATHQRRATSPFISSTTIGHNCHYVSPKGALSIEEREICQLWRCSQRLRSKQCCHAPHARAPRSSACDASPNSSIIGEQAMAVPNRYIEKSVGVSSPHMILTDSKSLWPPPGRLPLPWRLLQIHLQAIPYRT